MTEEEYPDLYIKIHEASEDEDGENAEEPRCRDDDPFINYEEVEGGSGDCDHERTEVLQKNLAFHNSWSM